MRWSRSSCVASSRRRRSAGLPLTRAMAKMTSARTNRSSTLCRIRLRMNRCTGGARPASGPGVAFRLRHPLGHVAELVPAGDRLEVADALGIHGPGAHALDDRYGDPALGHQLDHTVRGRRTLGVVPLGHDRLVRLVGVLAELRAVLRIAIEVLDTLGDECGRV